jgi:DNA-binding Lrp family transcriptional regulator
MRRGFLIAGQHDLVLHVAVRDMAHLKSFVSDHLNRRPEVVRAESHVIFESIAAGML